MLSLLFTAFVASAFAEDEAGSLSKLLQSKLEISTLLSCGNECPVPDPAILPLVSKNIEGCCPRDYLDPCTGLGLSRTIATWTINQEQGNSQTVCPAVPGQPAGCICQEFLANTPNNTFSICPKPKPCCPNCECHGDPHCKAFDDGTDDWVVCDNRGADCRFPKTNDGTCSKATYGGQPCAFIDGYCQWDSKNPALAAPKMVMYQKDFTYQGKAAKFSVTLFLGVYGSITSIEIVDPTSVTPYVFSFSAGVPTTQCTYPTNFPAGVFTKTTIDNRIEQFVMKGLGGGSVYMTFLCFKGKLFTGSRYEVPSLRDGSYVAGNDNFGGYCSSGKIDEQLSTDKGATLCLNYDVVVLKSTIFNRAGYNINCKATALTQCKLNWCGLHLIDHPNAPQKNWQALGFPSQQACATYIDGVGADGKNFIRALCAVSYKIHLADPTKCDADPDCKSCMDDVIDYPDEIVDNLIPGTASPGTSPGSPASVTCPTDSVFTAAGIARPTIPSPFAGVEIDFQATAGGAWVPIFSKTIEELTVWNTCKGHYCGFPFGNNAVFQKPGNYRMLQIYPGVTPDQCVGADSLTLSIQYPAEKKSASFSTPLGTAFDSGLLVCADGDGVKCPVDYQCCVWKDSTGFSSCMTDYTKNPNWQKVFPNCKPPV